MSAKHLSPSALNIFIDCPRCFWRDRNEKIRRPMHIFPSLPGGMDIKIKDYYDRHRMAGTMPPELNGKVEGVLMPSAEIMKKWRHWKSSDLKYVDPSGMPFVGGLDDCLVDSNFYIPLDYKTKGSALKEKDLLGEYYQNQMDCYCLMLEASGRPIKGIAYLVYYHPESVQNNGVVQFNVDIIPMETNTDRAKNLIAAAVACLNGPMPEPSPECGYCNYGR